MMMLLVCIKRTRPAQILGTQDCSGGRANAAIPSQLLPWIVHLFRGRLNAFVECSPSTYQTLFILFGLRRKSLHKCLDCSRISLGLLVYEIFTRREYFICLIRAVLPINTVNRTAYRNVESSRAIPNNLKCANDKCHPLSPSLFSEFSSFLINVHSTFSTIVFFLYCSVHRSQCVYKARDPLPIRQWAEWCACATHRNGHPRKPYKSTETQYIWQQAYQYWTCRGTEQCTTVL